MRLYKVRYKQTAVSLRCWSNCQYAASYRDLFTCRVHCVRQTDGTCERALWMHKSY